MNKFVNPFRIFVLATILLSVSGCEAGTPTPLYKSSETINQPDIQKYELAKDEDYKRDSSISSSNLPYLQYENSIVGEKTNAQGKENIKLHKIALLVPLSGDSKDLGKALQDSAQLALFDINIANFQLLPIDTKGTPEGAKEAVVKAIEEKVDLILGPLFSSSAKAIADIADDNDINIISFSNDYALTDEGVYLLGFMPEQQVRRVVNYASDHGIEEFSAILPKNKFGEVIVDELKSELMRKFKRTKTVEFYTSIDASLSHIIRKFVQPIEEKDIAEDDSVDTKDLELTENTEVVDGETNHDLLSDYDFEFNAEKKEPEKTEGILVPEGGRKATNIAARIFRHGMDSQHIRLLGTGQWDDPALLKEKKLVGSWFATSSPKIRTIFENHFKKIYGYKPVRIASLAYDGVALAAYLASKNDYSKSEITNRRGFAGINGVFRIRNDGSSERALAVIEITKNGFEVIDPAPENFNLFR